MKPRRRQSRLVTFTYGGIAMAILLVVAAVALVLAPPAPPSVAEFAPQAVDNIDEAPDNQSSRFGDGAGACAEGQVCEGTTTTTEPDDGNVGGGGKKDRSSIDVKRVRRCVGDPPRQTEDPQSPPCVNYFDGDNGGATAKGVTRDEIRVAIPTPQGPDVEFRYYEYLLDHFNTRYELYGRKLRLVEVRSASFEDFGVIDADEKQAFALLPDAGGFPDKRHLQREGARRGVVTVLGEATYASEQLYREAAPYAWSYGPSFDDLAAELGGFTCSSLAGRPARFAGPEFRFSERRFGVLVNKAETYPIDLTSLFDALGACGLERPPVYEVSAVDTEDDIARTYLNMRRDGTTSLLLLASAEFVTRYMANLPAEFEPEWVTSGLAGHEKESEWKVQAGPRRTRLFGTFTHNKLHRAEDTPAWWAFQEGPGGAHQWTSSDIHPARDDRLQLAYRSLLLLASGIQMAGPRLTPETFQTGLHKARFPNPGAGAAPYHQARVGFGPGDFTMVDDVSVVWWSDAAPSYGDRYGTVTGGWCYVDKGARFSRRTWRNVGDQLFNPDPGACR